MKEKTKKGNNKKQKILLIAIILFLCLSGVGVFFLVKNGGKETNKVVYSGDWDVSWYDENEKEFVITTKEQLFGLAELAQEIDFKGKTIKLGADIVVNDGNAEDWKEESPDLEWEPIGSNDMPFNGTFDGQGHTISGLYMDTSDELTGFFAATDNQSQIMNFKLINSYYNYLGDQGIGGVAGRGAGFFSQIYTDVVIDCDGWYVGGIMGFKKNNADCIIQECWYDGQINVTGRMAGGMVGQVFKGGCTISHCHNTGNIFSSFPGPQAATIGGLVGTTNQRLVISDCFNAGTLINEVGRPEVGSIIGSIGGNGDVTSGLIWSTNESAPTSVGGTNQDANVKGTFFQLPEELLTGYSAYQRTDLNFDKYWAVVEDGTPMLQVFADNVPSVAGLERSMEADTSWYDVTQLESVITTPEQLKGFATLAASGEKFYGKTIKLGADIVYNKGKASEYEKDIPINIWVPVNGFMGTFDGQGHTISGLYVGGAVTHVGLFAATEKQSVIKNLRIENSYFMSTDTSNSYGVGSVAGGGGGTIERVYSNAIIVSKGRYGGGIVGLFNKDGSISECWFDGEVAIEGRRSGGIVGACNNSYLKGNPILSTIKISHCLNTGYIHRTDKKATDSATSGGIVGVINNNSTTIEDCFSAGVVTSPKYQDKGFDELGAIVSAIASGANGTVKDCFGTIDSYKKVVTTIKKDSTSNISLSAVLESSMLKGYDAVSFTTLNFNKYWAVDVDGTPMLKCFAKSVPSVAGRIVPNTSWYNEKKTEFVLTTVEQLYGFSVLANSGITFEGKTVKLGNDITVNTGDAATWQTSATKTKWNPIRTFAGTFDGQGHTISGLYGIAADDSTLGMGLFAKTAETAVVQNFKLRNTYFETNAEYGLGAVASRGNGTFKNIYSDAILNNKKGGLSGGILGIALVGNVVIDNCWFDGAITDVGRRSGGILGYSNNQTVLIQHCLYTGSMKRVGAEVNNSMALFGGIIGSAKGNIIVNDCLSDGSFESERTVNADVMGAILGETTGNGTFSLTNSYGSASSASKAVGSNGAKVDITGCMKIEDSYLLGANACLFTMLDFKGNWSARVNNIPGLSSFTSNTEKAQVTLTCDTSWYSDDKSEFVLTTKEQLYGLTALALGKNFANKKIKLGGEITINSGDYTTYNTTAPAYPWMPIQNFAGTFDGQGNAIKNLYGSASKDSALGIGLFAATKETAVVRNIKVLDSYFETKAIYGLSAIASRGNGTFSGIHSNAILVNTSGKGLTGGVLGIALVGKVSIDNCWFEGKIIDSGYQSGGILGYANNQEVLLQNCLFTGSMKRTGENTDTNQEGYFGGIIGSAKGTVKVHNCLSAGTIESDVTVKGNDDRIGSILGKTDGSKTITLSNLYAASNTCDRVIGRKNTKYSTVEGADDCVELGIANLKDIKAYYNTKLDFDTYWDAMRGTTPMLKSFVTEQALVINLNNVIKHNTKWFDKTANKGTITTKEDLFGFSDLASEGAFNENTVIKLGADIVVNSLEGITTVEEWADPEKAPVNIWTPIENFAGTFDGQGYTISGLYMTTGTTNAGFFGYITDATIQNFRIENSYFESLIGTAQDAHMGSIVGRGYGILRNVYSNACIYTNGERVGGLVGYAGEQITNNGQTTTYSLNMVSCVYEGKIIIEQKIDASKGSSGQSTNLQSGGLVGYARKVVLDTCLSAGTLQIEHTSVGSTKKYSIVSVNIGGIVGQIGTSATVRNSLNASTINLVWKENSAFDETTSKFNNYGTIVGNGGSLTATNVYSVGTVKITLPGQTEPTVSYDEFVTGTNANNIAPVDKTGVDSTFAGKASDLYGDLAKTNSNLPFTLGERLALNGSDTNETALWVARDGKLPIPGTSVAPAVGNTDWHAEEKKDEKGAYHIATVDDLYGFAYLVNDENETFEGETIVLDANLEINSSETIAKCKTGDAGSAKIWSPIGNATTPFKGTFDGAGHSITGLYVNSSADYTGFFGFTIDCTVENLRLLKSYFTTTNKYLGSVSACGDGIFKNIYSEVDMNSTSDIIGGIIGCLTDGNKATTNTLIEHCWYNGTITQTFSKYANTGGIVGVVTHGYVYNGTATGNDYSNIIINSLFTGNINSTYDNKGGNTNKQVRLGGICGTTSGDKNSEILISNCISNGTISNPGLSDNLGSVFGRATGSKTSPNEEQYVTVLENVYASSSYNLLIAGDRTPEQIANWFATETIDFTNSNILTNVLNQLNGSAGTTWKLNTNATQDRYKLILTEFEALLQ